ncbi:MAG: Lrp/AsnC family transcriptional regulator [Eubacteriales bacterium]|nr:Lrp/AsnC family transcriptional regulator [Eubacteriales bacterium]
MHSTELDELDREILMILQHGIPIESRPYQKIAEMIGPEVTEDEVIRHIERMKNKNYIRRMSGFFESRKLGYQSMLVAVKPKEHCFEQAVEFINRFPGVTHNYERSHEYSIWFTLIAINDATLQRILDWIEECGYVESMMRFEMAQRYKINVTFDVKHGKGEKKHGESCH